MGGMRRSCGYPDERRQPSARFAAVAPPDSLSSIPGFAACGPAIDRLFQHQMPRSEATMIFQSRGTSSPLRRCQPRADQLGQTLAARCAARNRIQQVCLAAATSGHHGWLPALQSDSGLHPRAPQNH